MNTLEITLLILAVCAVYSFIAGFVTRNYSQVDRLWSVLPPVYVLIWAFDFGKYPLFWLTAVPVIMWGVRLTWNFTRRGGYAFSWKKGFYEEDYRWPILREKIPNRFLFELFNLFFITGFQLGLVFLFTYPVYLTGLAAAEGSSIQGVHIVLAAVHLALLVLETIADNQQFAFHARKKDTSDPDYKRLSLGFNTFGLWRFSRHPNYVCEMAQWVVVMFFAYSVLGSFNIFFFAAPVLIILFIGSTIMAEIITDSKYSRFKDWKKATPPWIPFIDWPLRANNRKAFFESLKN
jgi:steroid 5-alpha reductase family enzyme